jgi:hypothetical protein
LLIALKAWGCSPQTTQGFFASIDKDNTGRISEAEFLNLALDILKLKISNAQVYGQRDKSLRDKGLGQSGKRGADRGQPDKGQPDKRQPKAGQLDKVRLDKYSTRIDAEDVSPTPASPKLVSDFKSADIVAGEDGLRSVNSTASVTARLTTRVGTDDLSLELPGLNQYSHEALVAYTNSLVTTNLELCATIRNLAKKVTAVLKQCEVRTQTT